MAPVPRFEPFKGLRYRPEVAPIAQVIAPPYDVISSTERVHLASRHQANAVLVELPEADLPGGRDRYAVATDLFTRWQAERIIVAEPEPSLYPYRMTDTAGHTTTGVIGALGLAEPGEESDILPHEQTLPKPKSDRLDLLRATRANLSPIWGLSMAPGVTATFDPTDDEPVADAYDDDGVRHQLWVLSDPRRRGGRRRRGGVGARRPGRRPPPLRDGPGLPGRVPRRQRRPGRTARPRDGPRRRAVRGPAHRRRHPPHHQRAPGGLRPGRGAGPVVRRRAGRRRRRPHPRRAGGLATRWPW